MNKLKEELRYVNRNKIKEISDDIINNKYKFEDLLELALSKNEYTGLHASVIVLNIAKNKADLVEKHIDKIINSLPKLEDQGQIGNFLEIFELLKTDISALCPFFKILLANPDIKPFLKIDILNVLRGLAHIKPEKIQEIIDVIETTYNTYNTNYLQKTADVTLVELKDLELISKKKKSAFL